MVRHRDMNYICLWCHVYITPLIKAHVNNHWMFEVIMNLLFVQTNWQYYGLGLQWQGK
jgi:hypothetical protein